MVKKENFEFICRYCGTKYNGNLPVTKCSKCKTPNMKQDKN